jgi:putative exosortase-associated protein (TIGR04073 family)
MVTRSLPVLTLAGLLLFAGLADASSGRSYGVRAAEKLARGIVNVIASPLEIPVNAYKEQQRARDARVNIVGEGAALLTGTFTGIGYTGIRLLVAAAEIVTFPIATEPLLDPPAPNLFIETFGPPIPYGFVRQARGGEIPLTQRRLWKKAGASEADYYVDRYDCAAKTLRNGRFNQCLEERGWTRTDEDY